MITSICEQDFSAASDFNALSADRQASYRTQTNLICSSHERLLGFPLLSERQQQHDLALSLYQAPFAVLSHGTQADPILNYANRIALTLWQTIPDVLLTMPSRLTAEPMAQAARDKLMTEVTRNGFVTGYSGVRISATGRRFCIENVTIFNLTAPDGTFAGQAAVFDTWRDV